MVTGMRIHGFTGLVGLSLLDCELFCVSLVIAADAADKSSSHHLPFHKQNKHRKFVGRQHYSEAGGAPEAEIEYKAPAELIYFFYGFSLNHFLHSTFTYFVLKVQLNITFFREPLLVCL